MASRFAGGRPLKTPFGTIHGTNITPDPETGIGRWSEAAFGRALHEGLDRRHRGRSSNGAYLDFFEAYLFEAYLFEADFFEADFFEADFFEADFFEADFFEADFFEDDVLDDDDFFDGTLAPARRASDSPIAIACLRLLTFLPDVPLRSVPVLRSCMIFLTFDCAVFPYLAMIGSFIDRAGSRCPRRRPTFRFE